MTLSIDINGAIELSPYIFGHNLEHTRSAVGGAGGLSAQMLRNRKFAGKPQKNLGLAAEWEPIGEETAFFQMNFRPSYTKHIGCEKMARQNELSSQSIQNLTGDVCGMAQRGLYAEKGAAYEIRAAVSCKSAAALRFEIRSSGGRTLAGHTADIGPGDWNTLSFILTPDETCRDAGLYITFTEKTEVVFGAVSMMRADSFHGMRADVVEALRRIGPTIIRWPGGNFAGEYRWKDGLLPCDMRGPLQSNMEIETQPHSFGYDFHEISTDDFIALCREVGAEPFLTINLTWNSVRDSADWVEYCNGPADSEYGAKRAENGHPEPYNVKFWSLGNEMGYGHMEGPNAPSGYAALAGEHAAAMKEKSPDITLFSSGPYPNDDWARDSAAALYPETDHVSLHHYSFTALDYTTPEKTEETYKAIADSVFPAERLISDMRRSVDRFCDKIRISFDEWNFWYAWYRPSCVGEGIYAARMLHMMMYKCPENGADVCCYFQPVGEGAILVRPDGVSLTAIGQMFELMRAHQGGRLCPVGKDDDHCAAATIKDGVLTVTLINADYGEDKTFSFACSGEITDSVLLTSDSVMPHSVFKEAALDAGLSDGCVTAVLPPHSAARITVKIG